MTKQSAVDVIEQIEAAAKTHSPEVRMVRTMAVGEWFRQGDVTVTRIAAPTSVGAVRGSRQVAVGTSLGSRHVAEGEDVAVLERPSAGELDGPYVRAAGQRWTLAHPEHAHVSFPAGDYAVGYQLDMTTQRRVAD